MLADAPGIQVWLDTQPVATHTVIVPYVQSPRMRELNYQVRIVQTGPSGSSQISQGGRVSTQPDRPTALSRVSLSRHPGGECRIELTLREGPTEIGNYRFECTRE